MGIDNALRHVPGFINGPSDYLHYFYDFGSGYVGGLNQVISIKESGVSILAVVLLVAIILFVLFNWSDYHK